jgi:hypothetical protein
MTASLMHPLMKKLGSIPCTLSPMLCVRYHWHRMHGACGIIDTACTVHAVSLTLHACVHAVSLIPHAQCMLCHWNRINGTCGVNDTACTCACGINYTACTVHAVSLTPHAKYDTACTIDEQFERPWQPLKGIYIKNIILPELSYPTTKKIYKLKGAN